MFGGGERLQVGEEHFILKDPAGKHDSIQIMHLTQDSERVSESLRDSRLKGAGTISRIFAVKAIVRQCF